MKITVLGAGGGVGRQVVAQAVAAGHQVTALVRRPDSLDPALVDDIEVVRADLAQTRAEALSPAVVGRDAVLSALGARTAADGGIVSSAARSTIAAMRAAGVPRLIVVSAAPVGTVASPGRPDPPRHDPGDGPLTRYLLMPLVKRFFGASYADAALMEDLLSGSGLAWAVVRPPRLTNGPATGRYRTAVGHNVRGGTSVRRADVAALMLRLAGETVPTVGTVGIAGP